MTHHQAREAARIAADRENRYAEMSWREQLIVDRRAREVREENARRASMARH